ncbi:cyclase family protein [Desulfuromonas sp. TF]|uniref:cyclase family protein n=1 Tax=Desulfuromonas sp. TF TaxID=1232410 RepID=UPI0004126B69|nr:cyclase family protein [Desulfuromonas sp. TF]
MSDDAEWIDISVPITEEMATWPGDPPVIIDRVLDMAAGDDVTLSRLETGLHAGTHVDAPLHFLPGGARIDAMPIEAMTGPVRVIAIDADERIEVAHLRKERLAAGERVLFKTRNSRLWAEKGFIRDFVHLSLEAAEYLAGTGVRSVGIDYLSVSGYGKEAGEVHRVLLGAGVWIIEGLDLSRVVPGRYRLFCLPLKIAGAEAAPARVFLQRTGNPGRPSCSDEDENRRG